MKTLQPQKLSYKKAPLLEIFHGKYDRAMAILCNNFIRCEQISFQEFPFPRLCDMINFALSLSNEWYFQHLNCNFCKDSSAMLIKTRWFHKISQLSKHLHQFRGKFSEFQRNIFQKKAICFEISIPLFLEPPLKGKLNFDSCQNID